MSIFKKILYLCFVYSSAAVCAEHEISQKDKAFALKEMTVNVGDKIIFTNNDPFFHNIYSLTKGYSFDLGSYPKGAQRSVTVEEKGVIHVECAIHPTMKMTLNVE